MLDGIKALRARHIQRTQNHGIQYAEDDRVGADCQREREDRGEGKSGRFTQYAKAEACIEQQSFDPISAERFLAFLLHAGVSAEFDTRAPCRLGRIEPGTLQIVSAVLDMRAKLL